MRPIAYIAAATRSGSTHIKNCLVKLGWQPIGIHLTLEDHHNEEHMVDPRIAATLFPQGGFVIQQHSRAIGRNAFLLGEYGIRPIVTYRNILDSIVSFVDSTNQDSGDSSKSHLPIHIRNWKWMTYDEKSWWVAYNMTPWWLSFYASWRDSGLDCLLVPYERFFENQVRGLNEIVAHLGMDVLLDERVISIVDNKDSRFNVGKVGRGDRLPKELKKMVRHQASLYGLERELCDRDV